jgi:hypothetical protein
MPKGALIAALIARSGDGQDTRAQKPRWRAGFGDPSLRSDIYPVTLRGRRWLLLHDPYSPPDWPPYRQMTAWAVSRTGRYGAGRPRPWARSWHAWRTETPARLAAARM